MRTAHREEFARPVHVCVCVCVQNAATERQPSDMHVEKTGKVRHTVLKIEFAGVATPAGRYGAAELVATAEFRTRNGTRPTAIGRDRTGRLPSRKHGNYIVQQYSYQHRIAIVSYDCKK